MNRNHLIGRRTKRDITNEYGLILIPANTCLDAKYAELIKKHQITIAPDDLDFPAQKRKSAEDNEILVSEATEEIRDIFAKLRSGQGLRIQTIQASVIPSIYSATEFPSLSQILSGLQAKDDYTYRHNIGVGVVSTMIGRWLELPPDELSLLTLSAVLHDVGKIKITDEILNKPGKYSVQEYALMQKHTIYGYEILHGTSQIPQRVALAALQHHEREDGRGYPNGITGEKIDYYSKIVAVADVFHAMTSRRVYKSASPFYQVMEQMLLDRFGALDPFICGLFVQRMMSMTVGCCAELTDGSSCKIIMLNPESPTRPLIQIKEDYIDLRKQPELKLVKMIG